MIWTKLAKKVLTKAEQKHLTEVGVNSMEAFRKCREYQIKIKGKSKRETCFECRTIAIKLGIES